MANFLRTAIVRLLWTDENGNNAEPVGVGVLVDDKHVVTCAHVVNDVLGKEKESAESPSDETSIALDFPIVSIDTYLTGRVVVWDPPEATDVAVIRIEGDLPAEAAGTPFLIATEDGVSRQVMILGVPTQFQGRSVWARAETMAMVNADKFQFDGIHVTGVGVSPGFSGGGVWDPDLQRPIGIVVEAAVDSASKVGFGISTAAIQRVWDQLPTYEVAANLPAAAGLEQVPTDDELSRKPQPEVESGYGDLEIRIFPKQGEQYPVELNLAQGPDFMRGYVDASVASFSLNGSDEESGKDLFARLFADRILENAWAEARGISRQRRIRLRIDPMAPELRNIPWESMQEVGPFGTPLSLATSIATPFSRYLPTYQTAGTPVVNGQLRVLVAISNPKNLGDFEGLQPIDIEKEWATVSAAFKGMAVEVVQMDQPCRLEDILAALRKGFHVLHLVAHGRFSAKKEGGALFLADEQNETRIVDEELLGEVFSNLQANTSPALPDRLRLVSLVSCSTGASTNDGAFPGIASRLVQAGIPAVLAMQDRVSVESAEIFASGFYQSLLTHGYVDMAVNEARNSVLSAGLPGAHTPCLYMNMASGKLLAPETIQGEALVLPVRESGTVSHRLVRELAEWKLVHNDAQNLLNGLNLVMDSITNAPDPPTNDTQSKIGTRWQVHCARKLKKVRESWTFTYVQAPEIENVKEVAHEVDAVTRTLMTEDLKSLATIHNLISELWQVLWSALSVADRQLMQGLGELEQDINR